MIEIFFANTGLRLLNCMLNLAAHEELYRGSDEWITGKIELYKGKPKIVIQSPKQIFDVATAA